MFPNQLDKQYYMLALYFLSAHEAMNLSSINTFKYHVSCTDGKISVRINLLFYLFFTVVPSNTCVFLSCRPFVVNTTFLTGLVGVKVSSVSWLGHLTVGV